jgi:hypothetical protein
VVLLYARWQLGEWGGFADFDGHYHLKVVQWIAHQGLWADIRWLPFTVLGENGPDHHWLWHVALLPFTLIPDPGQALAWAAAANAAAAAAAIAFVLRLLGVPAAPLFALLAFCAGEAMPYRMLMLRAQNVALVFMFLAFWAMVQRRWILLGVLSFLFMGSYHAAVILLPMACIVFLTDVKQSYRAVIAVVAGLTAALVISPWFPQNVGYLMFHTLFKAASPQDASSLSSLVGSEWYPASARQILLESWPAHAALLLGAAALAVRRIRPRAETIAACVLSLLFLGMYGHAVRFAEYYIPFAVLASALAIRDAMGGPSAGLRVAVAAFLLAALPTGLAGAMPARVMPADHLEQVSAKLNELGQGGEMVFNSSWPDFMALVWWADRFRYINGLDGHYLAYQDPARFAIWLALSGGGVEDPATVIRLVFGARYAVIARQHAVLAAQLEASAGARLLVASPEAWLFEILPAAAGTPKAPAR